MLISEEYKRQNAELHRTSTKYGSNGWKEVANVLPLIEKYNIQSVLDYGSGKGRFKEQLSKSFAGPIFQYDPALNLDERRVCDLVVCRDVLEHVEIPCLDDVLKDLRRLTGKLLYAKIATTKSSDILPDGSNAHKIVHEGRWWEPRLRVLFDIDDTVSEPKKALFIMRPK